MYFVLQEERKQASFDQLLRVANSEREVKLKANVTLSVWDENFEKNAFLWGVVTYVTVYTTVRSSEWSTVISPMSHFHNVLFTNILSPFTNVLGQSANVL